MITSRKPHHHFYGYCDKLLLAGAGISSLQVVLPATWTQGRQRGLTFEQMVRIWCVNPAELAGMGDIKGQIAKGFDADFVIWDPDQKIVIDDDFTQFQRHKNQTAYKGEKMMGGVRATFVRGQLVFADGKQSATSCGSALLKGSHF